MQWRAGPVHSPPLGRVFPGPLIPFSSTGREGNVNVSSLLFAGERGWLRACDLPLPLQLWRIGGLEQKRRPSSRDTEGGAAREEGGQAKWLLHCQFSLASLSVSTTWGTRLRTDKKSKHPLPCRAGVQYSVSFSVLGNPVVFADR